MVKTIAHLADIHIRKLHRFVEYRQVFKNLYKQLKELTEWQSNELCEDPYAELLESAIGHPCQYAPNSTSNLETNIIQQETPPPYN